MRQLQRIAIAACTVFLAIGAPSAGAQTITTAEQLKPMADTFRRVWSMTNQPTRMSIPLHGGILELSMPLGFVPAFRAEQDGTFLMAFVPDGETFPFFSRALLVQSSATLGEAPYSDAEVAEGVYKPRECAGSPLWRPVGAREVGPLTQAFIASTGCASLKQDPSKGQQTFVASVRRTPHAFAVSWAVRSAAFVSGKPPISHDDAESQLKPLGPLLFCTAADQPDCKGVFEREAIRRSTR